MKLGLLAGSGLFPLLVARAAKKTGVQIVALAVRGVTDAEIEKIADHVDYVRLGQISKPIQILKEAGVSKAVMAGKIEHASLFGSVMPDWRAAKLLAALPDLRTDTVLGAVASECLKEGIELLPSSSFLSHLLAAEGAMTRPPSAKESAELSLGFDAAKGLGHFDIGQTVVLSGGAVVAVEGIEGTDACIRRARELTAAHGERPPLTVVKTAKPRQDPRFDLPVVGLDTLSLAEECGVAVLGIEAGKTLIFDKDDFIQRARAMSLCMVGLK